MFTAFIITQGTPRHFDGDVHDIHAFINTGNKGARCYIIAIDLLDTILIILTYIFHQYTNNSNN